MLKKPVCCIVSCGLSKDYVWHTAVMHLEHNLPSTRMILQVFRAVRNSLGCMEQPLCVIMNHHKITLTSFSAIQLQRTSYIGLTTTVRFTGSVTSFLLSIDIVENLLLEPTEHFNISLSTSSEECVNSPE